MGAGPLQIWRSSSSGKPEKASLPIDSSRAAATAYKIASQPASDPEASQLSESSPAATFSHMQAANTNTISLQIPSSDAGEPLSGILPYAAASDSLSLLLNPLLQIYKAACVSLWTYASSRTVTLACILSTALKCLDRSLIKPAQSHDYSQSWISSALHYKWLDGPNLEQYSTDLGDKIKEVLDRRKQGIVESGSMSEEGRAALIKQLMALVARLEEEMFQAEAHKFEAEVLD